MIFQYIHQTKHSLTYQMPTLFSKDHVTFGFEDEAHLTHQKSDPSDPDCPGHPTHFQPWLYPLGHNSLSILVLAVVLIIILIMIIFQSTWQQLDITPCSYQSHSVIVFVWQHLAFYSPRLFLSGIFLYFTTIASRRLLSAWVIYCSVPPLSTSHDHTYPLLHSQ